MVQLNDEIFKLLEEGSAIQYQEPQKAKELFFQAQSRAQERFSFRLSKSEIFKKSAGTPSEETSSVKIFGKF